MIEDMETWEREDGIKFLKKVGLRSGQIVLDFGCRVGHYTVPAAFVVGSTGVVYAVDKEKEAINELSQKAKDNNLKNVKAMEVPGRMNLPLESGTVDVVLFYDVLHYLGKYKRARLYQEAFRVLKQYGLLSVYPKHTLEDAPAQEFRWLSLSDVKREIERSNFVFEQKHCGLISHDDGFNQGCVLNFIKSEQVEKYERN